MAEQTRRPDPTISFQDRQLHEALATLLEEISLLAGERPRLAAAVHTVAGYLFEKTTSAVGEIPDGQMADDQASGLPAGHAIAPEPATACQETGPAAFRAANIAHPHSLAQPTAHRPQSGPATPEISKPRYSDVTDDDLSLMVERCRLKAEGTLWALEREERLRDGADFHEEIRPSDQEIIQRAKQLPNCFLWMNQPRDDIWKKAGDFDIIADCFDALAESLAALDASLDAGTPEQFLQAVNLTAESQSALRTAVNRVDNYPDSDQQMAYHWLRNRASQDRFYIARYLKISDPANPDRAEAVIAEAQQLQEQLSSGHSENQTSQERRDVA